jgi:DNA-binding CsgD family transcriptional regulator/TPR repeat protein
MAAPLVKPILCPILIGRGPYIAALQKCVDEAATGCGQAILVSGEAGIGKSRLVAEVGAYAVDHGFHVIVGHCFEHDEALPYAPLLDVLRTLFKLLETAPGVTSAQAMRPFAPELIRLLPDLSAVFSDIAVDPYVVHEPEQEKRRLVDAFTLLVAEIAARQPLMLLIEDVHWCDEASLDALFSLARRLATQSVFIVLTYRSDDVRDKLGHLLALLDRERLAAEVRLPPLNVSEVERMLGAMLGLRQSIRADQLNFVYGLSDGNPFFVEELLRTLVGAGLSASAEDFQGLSSLDAVRVPRTVEEAVQRRVAGLGASARQLVALAAVAGRTFTFALLQELTGQSESEVLEHLKELVTAQLIIEVSNERFAFRHALTRQAIYAELLARERRALHRHIAEALEEALDGAFEQPADLSYDTKRASLSDLAYHCSQAAMWDRALLYARRAAEQALALYAPRAALEHLARALEAARRLPDAPRAPLHRLGGQAYEMLGDFEAARVSYLEALAAARSSHDDMTQCWILIDLGNLWAGRDYAQAGMYFQQAAEYAHSRGDAFLHAHSLNRLGNWFANTGRMKEGIASHQQALTLFEERRDLAGQAATLDLLGMAYALNAEFPSAMREFSRAIDLLRTLGDRRGLLLCLASRLAFGSGCMSDTTVPALMSLEECLRDAGDAEQHAREIQWPAGLAYVLLQTGRAEAAFGKYGSAFHHVREALRIAREIKHQQWAAAAHYALGRFYLALLAPDRATLELETGLALAQVLGSSVWIGLITADLARAFSQRGDGPKAKSALSAVMPYDALKDRNTLDDLTLTERELALQWARLDLQRNDPERALNIVTHLEETVSGDAPDQPVLELLLAHAEALIQLRQWNEVEGRLDSARHGGIQRMNPVSLWQAHALLARVYHATKREELARQESAVAYGLAEQLAATIEEVDLREGFINAALAFMPRTKRGRHPLHVAHSPDMLTPREREVSELIAQGASNREIAASLVVSERTVTTHVSNILGKLAFTSRTQIVAWFYEGVPGKP